MVTLVGGSATGKTRACWELARFLDRREPGRWRWWGPADQGTPKAIESALAHRVDGHTLVWLDEARFYLAYPPVVAGLRVLLRRPGPILVLATLWPDRWDAFAHRSDPYPPTRTVLAGTAVPVPDAFIATECAPLDGTDPRLRDAAAHAADGRIVQYLAGTSQLERRYRDGPPAARAVVHAAIDACRAGHPPAMSVTLLNIAAAGYLRTEHLHRTWLPDALNYLTEPHRGTDGPMTALVRRPVDPDADDGHAVYQLADPLEEIGHHERAGVYPPASLWHAFDTATAG